MQDGLNDIIDYPIYQSLLDEYIITNIRRDNTNYYTIITSNSEDEDFLFQTDFFESVLPSHLTPTRLIDANDETSINPRDYLDTSSVQPYSGTLFFDDTEIECYICYEKYSNDKKALHRREELNELNDTEKIYLPCCKKSLCYKCLINISLFNKEPSCPYCKSNITNYTRHYFSSRMIGCLYKPDTPEPPPEFLVQQALYNLWMQR